MVIMHKRNGCQTGRVCISFHQAENPSLFSTKMKLLNTEIGKQMSLDVRKLNETESYFLLFPSGFVICCALALFWLIIACCNSSLVTKKSF